MEDNKEKMLENNGENAAENEDIQPVQAEEIAPETDVEETDGGEFCEDGEELSEEEAATTAAEQAAAEKAARRAKLKKELREWVVSLAVAALIALVVRSFLFTLIRVDGDSMYRTLNDGERLFVTIADVKFGGAERGDVVICHYPNRGRTYFVKRVVGMPGDQVERVNGVTYVTYTDENGQTVREAMDGDRSLYYPNGSPTDYEPYTLGEDEFFVVGDNRYNSHDSRDWKDTMPDSDVGPISGDMIIGQAQFVIWPPEAIRRVK